MQWVMAVMFCIQNAPDVSTKKLQSACVQKYAECMSSPGRRDKSCELKVLEFYKKS